MSLEVVKLVKGRMEVFIAPTQDNMNVVWGRQFYGRNKIKRLGHRDRIYNTPQQTRFFIKIFNRGWKEE